MKTVRAAALLALAAGGDPAAARFAREGSEEGERRRAWNRGGYFTEPFRPPAAIVAGKRLKRRRGR